MSQWEPQPPQSPVPSAAGSQPYPPSAPSGALAWGLGLLVLVCVPFVSSIAAGIAMAIAGRGLRGRGEPGASNGRHAANWGLTYLVATVVLVSLHFGLLFALTREHPVEDFFPLGIPITLWLLISLLHVVLSIVGLVRAGSGKILSPPAIPFFRA